MRRVQLSSALFVIGLMVGTAVVAQSPGAQAGDLVLKSTGPTSGIGVSNAPLIDRQEIRVLRVDVAPQGVRYVHTHDDMQYHLFIPTMAGMEFELDGAAPVPMRAWQAQFIKGGTRHGFKNLSASTVTIMEIFVKK